MMKPILFSTPMVQAILEGRKTQTRRKVKLQPGEGEYYEKLGEDDWAYISHGGMSGPYTCPYGKVGDILWVRETWQKAELSDECEYDGYIYKADKSSIEWVISNDEWKWKPSIFMPKEACRLFLKIKSVRVERLQVISDADAVAEGIEERAALLNQFKDYIDGIWTTPFMSYRSLWKSINGEQSWNDNPFVWVIEFERTEKPV